MIGTILSYKEQKRYTSPEGVAMTIAIDAQDLIAIAAIIGSLSSLVWSIRRSPGRSPGKRTE